MKFCVDLFGPWIFLLISMTQLLPGDTSHLPKCEKISTTLCQHLGYNMTMMPNFAGHNSQLEASRGVSLFIHLQEWFQI